MSIPRIITHNIDFQHEITKTIQKLLWENLLSLKHPLQCYSNAEQLFCSVHLLQLYLWSIYIHTAELLSDRERFSRLNILCLITGQRSKIRFWPTLCLTIIYMDWLTNQTMCAETVFIARSTPAKPSNPVPRWRVDRPHAKCNNLLPRDRNRYHNTNCLNCNTKCANNFSKRESKTKLIRRNKLSSSDDHCD